MKYYVMKMAIIEFNYNYSYYYLNVVRLDKTSLHYWKIVEIMLEKKIDSVIYFKYRI